MQPANNTASQPVDVSDFLTIKGAIGAFPLLGSEASWRWRIFRRHENGLLASRAIAKRGGRWFICRPRLAAWLAGDGAAQLEAEGAAGGGK
jgi:hypothetical protein